MTTDAMIETVRRAFANDATAANKQAGAQVLRVALAALEATPGQPLEQSTSTPTSAQNPTPAPAPATPDALDMLISRFMEKLPQAEQDRIRGEVDDNSIPLVAMPGF